MRDGDAIPADFNWTSWNRIPIIRPRLTRIEVGAAFRDSLEKESCHAGAPKGGVSRQDNKQITILHRPAQ